MFADVSALHAAILDEDARTFVSHHMFEQVPYAFEENRDSWISWKHTLADLIDVDPHNIVMTGSAAIGFSLNPYKKFKKFDLKSDFDCGVVSEYYFDVAWRYLRQLRVSWLTLPDQYREEITSHRKNYVFSGTIAADRMLSLLPFGQKWQTALDKMMQIDPTKGRDVKLRIYKDFDSLRYYQASGLEKLRDKIIEIPDEDNGEIAVEEDK